MCCSLPPMAMKPSHNVRRLESFRRAERKYDSTAVRVVGNWRERRPRSNAVIAITTGIRRELECKRLFSTVIILQEMFHRSVPANENVS